MQKVFLFVILFFYFVPLCKFFHCAVRVLLGKSSSAKPRSEIRQQHALLKLIAATEYYFQMLRFYCVGVPVLIWTIVFGVMLFFDPTPRQEHILFVLGLFSLLIIWHLRQKHVADLRASQFVLLHPEVHPDVFFLKYRQELAFGCVNFYDETPHEHTTVANANFKKSERPVQKWTILLRCFVDTAYVAHICLTALRVMGPVYLQSFADHIGSVWGKRMLQQSQAHLVVMGMERMQGLTGRILLIFNHKSALDFVLSFFALSGVRVNNRHVKTRFILAQDHFKDNWFIYKLLGIGRVAEAMNMVFVSRKDQKVSVDRLKQAAHFMVEKDIDVAIYPQGTRATGNFDRALKRRDAGFYTTIRPKDVASRLAHIKRGTPYLILDILQTLSEKRNDESLHLVFIGINGTATLLPKGSWKIQTESDVEFCIGDVVTLTPELLQTIYHDELSVEEQRQQRRAFVQHMCAVINERLLMVLDLPTQLEQRFLTELKGQFRFDNDKIDQICYAMDTLSKKSDLVYQILDRIYSLPLHLWNGYLSHLSQLLLEQTSEERLELLMVEVAEELLKNK